MQYELSNGVKVNLMNSFDTAKFLLFAYPKLNVNFVGEVPRMVLTPKVNQLIKIRAKIIENQERLAAIETARQQLRMMCRDEFDDSLDDWTYGDDIPF